MDTTLHDPLLGRMLDARYRVEQRIAVGGMATVYRGLDTRLDRVIALKVMHAGLASDPEFTARFIREAKAVARLSHPNVVNVFDQGNDGSAVFLAMEYVPGWTLRDLLRDRGALTPRTALDIMEPILAALGAAHRSGLVHRDVKPENVLLTEDGRVKVTDFGLVRAVSGESAPTTGQVMGTVSYLAPEQIEQGAADPRTDVYACGILLFEMLTGRKPYTGETPMQVIYQHLSADVPPPSTLVPGLAPELDAITVAATARDAGRRPADAVELLAALQRIRRALAPAQLDAEPGPAGLPVAGASAPERTTVMPAGTAGTFGPGAMRQLPPDLVMPRRPVPEDRPLPSRAAAGRPRRRRGWAMPAAVLLVLTLVAGGAAWALNGLYTQLPSVLGQTQGVATQTLQADGLTVAVRQDFSAVVGKGKVIGTDPAPGSRIRKDSTVTLDVSKGPDNPTVPDLAGRTQAAAEQALKDAGLTVGQISQQTSGNVASGSVVSTDPAGGTQQQPNTPVNLVVSSGADPVDLPNVVGESVDQATQDLQNAGFTVQLDPNQVYSDQADAGQVAAQSPSGSQAAQGSTVTLTVSKGQQQATVPDVSGMTEKDARKALEQAGFKVQVIRLNPFGSPTVHIESPNGGSQAALGSKVTITLL
ncbi:Stk1 family PASTA domain-containing Ser/Thr kinase [Streptacidiphilus sp. EB129]|uniref:Stk1 family PASTA domain-containing Ser/Thr kinase n=1 Tax=Streptacidiphilus sp. EB129 TaxID=3156262 RepID=UPI0035195B1A